MMDYSTTFAYDCVEAPVVRSTEDAAYHSRIDTSYDVAPVPVPAVECPYVGATIPENVTQNKWSKFRALVYTEQTAHMVDETHVSAPGRFHIKEEANITIIPRSDQAEFNPKCRQMVPWIGEFISETFYVRLLPGHKRADIILDFMVEHIAVPFGQVRMTVSIDDEIQSHIERAARHTIYFLHTPADNGIVDYISDALAQVDCDITDNIADADRVQLIFSSHLLDLSDSAARTLQTAKRYRDRLAITYYDGDMLQHIERDWSDVPRSFYDNNAITMMQDIKTIKNNQTYMIGMLQQCMDMLVANFNAICDSSDNKFPHLFHVWPARRPKGLSRLNPKNWVYYRYKLHLLCEGTYIETGRSDDHEHYMFGTHPGYSIDMPKDWFAKWGPVLALAVKITCIACKIAICATGAGSLADMIPNGLPLDTINKALPILDIVSEELYDKDVGTLVAEKAQDYLQDFDTALSNADDMDSLRREDPENLNQLAQFLQGREPFPEYAGLQRCFYPQSSTHNKAGKVVWLCRRHARCLSASSGVRSTII